MIQIIPPYRPGVSTRVFGICILQFSRIKLFKHILTVLVGYIFFTSPPMAIQSNLS